MNQQERALPSGLFMDIDRSGHIPLYVQFATCIENAIVSGDLPPGSRLENEVALGERIGLSRPTVRRAIQELVNKGLLVRRRGIGTQVVHGQVTGRVELTSLYDDLASGGRHPSTNVLLHEVIEADARIAEFLVVPIGDPILHLRRVRSGNEVPIAVLENYVPSDFTNITVAEMADHGLYQVLHMRGTIMRVARQRIGARRATVEESDLLEIGKRGFALTMDRTAYDDSGRAVEFGQHCYRPDAYSFEITLVNK